MSELIFLMTQVKRYFIVFTVILLMSQTVEAVEGSKNSRQTFFIYGMVGVGALIILADELMNNDISRVHVSKDCYLPRGVVPDKSGNTEKSRKRPYSESSDDVFSLREFVGNFKEKSTLNMPTIRYDTHVLVMKGKRQSIQLVPVVEYGRIDSVYGNKDSITEFKVAKICEPINEASLLDKDLEEYYGQCRADIYRKCIERVEGGVFILPHEFSGTILEENHTIVLPMLVYVLYEELSFIARAVPLVGKKAKLSSGTNDKYWIQPLIDGLTINKNFKICHFTNGMAEMNPPIILDDNAIFFLVAKNGVSRLHDDNGVEYFIATNGYNVSYFQLAAYWISGVEWPKKINYLNN